MSEVKFPLKVVVIQDEIHWNDEAANLNHFGKKIEAIEASEVDLIVLPEMFTTGFSMDKLAALHDEGQMKPLDWMKAFASEKQACITGSIKVKSGEEYYNRLYWVNPEGEVLHYNKRHLFTFAGEDQHFSAGKERLVVECKGWRIGLFVCYDLRFPIWSRNMNKGGLPLYDAALYVANWPAVRAEPWNILLKARAIENQCYVIACNRVGKDTNGHLYSGNSGVIDPKGVDLSASTPFEATTISAELSFEELSDFRKKFPVIEDGDWELLKDLKK